MGREEHWLAEVTQLDQTTAVTWDLNQSPWPPDDTNMAKPQRATAQGPEGACKSDVPRPSSWSSHLREQDYPIREIMAEGRMRGQKTE